MTLTLRRLSCVLAGAFCIACSAAETAEPVSGKAFPLEVVINGSPAGSWVLLEQDGALYAQDDAFEEWRLMRPKETSGIAFRNQTWYPLASVPGYDARRDFSTQSVDLRFSPAAFGATRFGDEPATRPALTPTAPALFVNYDVNITQAYSRFAAPSREIGALAEIGLASSMGVFTSSFVAPALPGSKNVGYPGVRRLETGFTRDFADDNITVRVGDSVTRGTRSGRSVYFGGVQVAKNFALSPGLMRQPVPTIAGVSSSPSTMSLYINDALRQVSEVPAGPFAIENFPILTGAGEARVVTRDLLGRESVVVQRFFTDPSLLAPGLSDWSVESGAVRQNLGIESADYGERFVAGVIRSGVTPSLTAEGQAQISSRFRQAGVGFSVELPFQTLGQVALAASASDGNKRGYEWSAGAERKYHRHTASVHAQGGSRDFRQLGLDAGISPQRSAMTAAYSYNSAQTGSLGAALTRVETHDRSSFHAYSASYTVRVGERSALTFNATRLAGTHSGMSFSMLLNIPLGNRMNVSTALVGRGGSNDVYVRANQAAASEMGTGWHASAGKRAGQAFSEGGMHYQGSKALLIADVAATQTQQTVRAGAQGALVVMDGKLFGSRRLDESFALVEVPGYPGVAVGFQGSMLTRTDKDGMALLPRLLPYQSNSIRLDPTELPISAELDTIEQVVVPAARSGVRVRFPVRSGRGALIRIVMPDGEPAPAGAEIELAGDDKKFFVARRGEAFVTGLQAKNTLLMHWKNSTCGIGFDLPPGSLDEIARIGPLTCAAGGVPGKETK